MTRLWNDEEDTLLKRLWPRPDITSQMLTKIFIGRSATSIKSHASILGLHKEYTSNIDYEALKAIEI